MIVGIGVDLVDIRRIRAGNDRFGNRLAQKLLSALEMSDYHDHHDQAALLAKRFAAKEALVKALGIGFRNGVQLPQISIIHDKDGRPGFQYQGRIADILKERGVKSSHLSISDEKQYAIAYVVLES